MPPATDSSAATIVVSSTSESVTGTRFAIDCDTDSAVK